MSVLDLVIVYLAIGTPFGVYQLATQTGEIAVSSFVPVLLNVLLWPLTALSRAYSRYKDPLQNVADSVSLITEMEKIASRSKASPLFEFREVLTRYVGLSAALEMPVGTRAIESLAEICRISNKETAKACLTRKNRARLDSQRSASRKDVVDLVDAIALADPKILLYTAALFRSLGDHAGTYQLEQRAIQCPNTAQGPSASGPVSLAA